MKVSNTVSFLAIASLLTLSITSCKEDEEIPQNVYVQSVTVINTISPTGDPFSDADLRVDFGKASDGNYQYSTNVSIDNATLPVVLEFPAEILATDEDWNIRLVDQNTSDFPSTADETIYTITFNPTVSITNNERTLKVNTLDALTINVDQR